MKKNLLILLLSCLAINSKAQPSQMMVDELDFKLGWACGPIGNVNLKVGYKVGYVDKHWNYVVAPNYEAGSDFFGDYANIIKNGVSGLVDKSGKELLFPQFDLVYKYYPDLLLAKKDNKYGFIHLNGEVAIPIIYDQVGFFSEGYVAAKLGDEWQLLDSLGRSSVDSNIVLGHHFFVYQSLVEFEGYNSDKTGVAKKPKQGLLHLTEGVVIEPKYDELAGYFVDGLCWVKRDGKQGFISDKGEEVIPVEYDEISWEFYGGLAKAKKDGRWGFIDKQNKVVIPFQYEWANNFSEHLAPVQKDRKVGFVDRNNKVVIPFLFDPDWRYQFSEGLSPFKLNGKFGYINKRGKVVIPPSFASALKFVDGLAYVTLPSKKECFINKKGAIVSPEFEKAWNFRHGLARVVVK